MTDLDLSKPLIMGILNVTPDSFSDGGAYPSSNDAIKRAIIMVEQGANIIDVGGESTRPGSKRVSAIEQKRRILDVISQIRKELPSEIIISVDTMLSEVAIASIDCGANMINDVSGGTYDPKIMNVAAENNTFYCIMHMQGTPEDMQDNPKYNDVVKEIIEFLDRQAKKAISMSINREKIIIDPGIGFGKLAEHNLEILKNLKELSKLDYITLLGASRKKIFLDVSDVSEPSNRISGTCATSALGVLAGINIFRVHDVWQNKQAIDIAFAIKNSK